MAEDKKAGTIFSHSLQPSNLLASGSNRSFQWSESIILSLLAIQGLSQLQRPQSAKKIQITPPYQIIVDPELGVSGCRVDKENVNLAVGGGGGGQGLGPPIVMDILASGC